MKKYLIRLMDLFGEPNKFYSSFLNKKSYLELINFSKISIHIHFPIPSN